MLYVLSTTIHVYCPQLQQVALVMCLRRGVGFWGDLLGILFVRFCFILLDFDYLIIFNLIFLI